MLWRQGNVTAFHWLGIALIAFASTSLLWNTDPLGGVHGLWMLCIVGLTFWLGSTLRTLQQVYAGLAIGGAVSSAIAVMQALGHPVLPSGEFPAGLYYNSVAQGEILALLVVALFSERMYFYAVPLIPGILLAQSRGAWLALAFGLLATLIQRSWLLPAAAVMVGAAMWIGQPSDAIRLRIWLAAYGDFSWFGNGVGSFASQMYMDRGAVMYPEFVHNDALQLIYEYGIGAAIPAVIFAFVLLQTQMREWPVVLAFVIMGFYSFSLYMPVTAFIGLLAAGRIVRDWHRVRRFGNYCGFVSDVRQWWFGSEAVPLVSTNKGSC